MQARDKGGMAPGRVKSFTDPGETIGFTGANSTQVLHALTFRFLPHTFIPHDQGLHPLLLKLAQAIRIPIIASGGLNSVNDVKAVCKLAPEGVVGAIAGRALYEGKLDFKQAQAAADKATAKA